MRRKKISDKISRVAPCFAAFIIFAAALLEPKATYAGVKSGIELCIDTVVPSLFALMFAVSLLGECGVMAVLSHRLSPLSRALGLPEAGSAALVAAALGGYPAGAKTALGMFERSEISQEEARLLAELCVCAGPAFIFGMSGTLIPTEAAVVLVIVEPCAMLFCAAAARFLHPVENRITTDSINYVNSEQPITMSGKRSFSECTVNAASQTASAMLSVCVFVVLFRALREILAVCGAERVFFGLLMRLGLCEDTASAALPVLLEVTSGSAYAARAGLPALAFALGFGGISVHMQIFGICRKLHIRAARFELLRLIQGMTAALITSASVRFLPSIQCASVTAEQKMTASTPAGAVTLIIMCIMFTLCTEPDDGLIRRRRSRYPCNGQSVSCRSRSERAWSFRRPR